jgi:hypothetical protein
VRRLCNDIIAEEIERSCSEDTNTEVAAPPPDRDRLLDIANGLQNAANAMRRNRTVEDKESRLAIHEMADRIDALGAAIREELSRKGYFCKSCAKIQTDRVDRAGPRRWGRVQGVTGQLVCRGGIICEPCPPSSTSSTAPSPIRTQVFSTTCSPRMSSSLLPRCIPLR